jgi:uncharacterized protein (DUF736 family)
MEIKFKKNENKKSDKSPDFFLEFSEGGYTGAAWKKVRPEPKEGFSDDYLSAVIDKRVESVQTEPDWKKTQRETPPETAF